MAQGPASVANRHALQHDVDVRADGEPSANWRNRKRFQSCKGSHFYGMLCFSTLGYDFVRLRSLDELTRKTLGDFSPTAPDLQCAMVGLANFVQVQIQADAAGRRVF